MLLGYARVSLSDGSQKTDLQVDALTAAGVERIWEDQCSGAIAPEERPEFSRLLDVARKGDEVVVWALDRVGRSASSTLRIIELLTERGIQVRVLKEGLTTGGATGTLVLQILAAVAQMERSLILERSREGMAASRARGVHQGRPASLTTGQQEHARELRASGKSLAEVARLLGTSKSTVARVTTGE